MRKTIAAPKTQIVSSASLNWNARRGSLPAAFATGASQGDTGAIELSSGKAVISSLRRGRVRAGLEPACALTQRQL